MWSFDEIIGLKINESVIKLSMYADDMTGLLVGTNSVKKLMAELDSFKLVSGLGVNIDKYIGTFRNRYVKRIRHTVRDKTKWKVKYYRKSCHTGNKVLHICVKPERAASELPAPKKSTENYRIHWRIHCL